MGNKRKLFQLKKCTKTNKERLVHAREVKRQKKGQNILDQETSTSYCNVSNDYVSVVTNAELNSAHDCQNSVLQNSNLEESRHCNSENIAAKDIFLSLIQNLERQQNNEVQSTEGELKSVEESDFVIQSHEQPCPPFKIEGRRIVDFDYFFNQMKIFSNHNTAFGCTISNLQITNEKLNGLNSITYLKCDLCNSKFELGSNADIMEEMSLNHAAVTGAMLVGCGRTNLNELLTSMDLPNLNQKTYSKCHDTVSNWWKTAAKASMKEAAEEEAELAVESGNVIDGIPAITVVADACWSKRSYRTNYSAASGAAAIIGYRTGKVLFMDVKNKYCIVCARGVVKNQPPPSHQCSRNHTGSSTSMEQAIIVEGFKSSVETHNLIYATLIADGDASTYKKVLESRPYPNVQVQKIECSNHLLRNYCSKLMQLQKDTSIPLAERKLLTAERIKRLRTAVRTAARFRKAQNYNISDKIIKLKDDILNSPKHVFGNHNTCEDYFCTEERKNEQNMVPLVKTLLGKMMVHTTQLSLQSRSLLHDVNNNRAEQFNSIVAKHVGGKRINYSLKNSYTARCHAAVVSFNTAKVQYSLHKTNFNTSPRKSIKLFELRRFKRNQNRRTGPRRKIIFQNDLSDYGEQCQRPDLTPEQYEIKKKLFLQHVKTLVEKRHDVERDTVLQAECALWLELRRYLITASSFSKICKRRQNISSAPLVKSLVYTYCLDNVAAIIHGKTNEKTAIEQLQKQEGVVVQKCGLFVDEEYFFLGASPDGLFDEGIIEIKCPYSARNMDVEQAIIEKKITFWKTDGTINKNHDWYYQIQGQLHISQKNVCLFAAWTGTELRLKTIKLRRDDEFWNTKMKHKLIQFYDKCLLPEMVDPRKSRSMPIRDIPFTVE